MCMNKSETEYRTGACIHMHCAFVVELNLVDIMWMLSEAPLIGSVMQKFRPCRGMDISQNEVEAEK